MPSLPVSRLRSARRLLPGLFLLGLVFVACHDSRDSEVRKYPPGPYALPLLAPGGKALYAVEGLILPAADSLPGSGAKAAAGFTSLWSFTRLGDSGHAAVTPVPLRLEVFPGAETRPSAAFLFLVRMEGERFQIHSAAVLDPAAPVSSLAPGEAAPGTPAGDSAETLLGPWRKILPSLFSASTAEAPLSSDFTLRRRFLGYDTLDFLDGPEEARLLSETLEAGGQTLERSHYWLGPSGLLRAEQRFPAFDSAAALPPGDGQGPLETAGNGIGAGNGADAGGRIFLRRIRLL